jgi:hypothetical protein
MTSLRRSCEWMHLRLVSRRVRRRRMWLFMQRRAMKREAPRTVDSGSSRHMTGMRSVFLSVLEMGSNFHMKNGVHTRHAIKGVGYVRVQLESGVSLEVDEVMYVPELKVNLLSISILEDMGYEVMFVDGQVLIRVERVAC